MCTQSFFLQVRHYETECFAWLYLDQLIDKAVQKIFLTFENSQSIPGLLQNQLKHYPTINILVLVLPTILLSFCQFFFN